LLEIAHRDDGGKPKTGRRYYYLALSHGYIVVIMPDTPEGKKSRGWTDKTAENWINVYQLSGKFELNSNLELSLGALYLLAAPSTLDDVRENVLARTHAAEPISHAEVRSRIEEARTAKPAHRATRESELAVKISALPSKKYG